MEEEKDTAALWGGAKEDDDDIAIGSTEPLLCLELRGTSTTASHCCVEEEGDAPSSPDHRQARKEDKHRLDLDTAQTPVPRRPRAARHGITSPRPQTVLPRPVLPNLIW